MFVIIIDDKLTFDFYSYDHQTNNPTPPPSRHAQLQTPAGPRKSRPAGR